LKDKRLRNVTPCGMVVFSHERNSSIFRSVERASQISVRQIQFLNNMMRLRRLQQTV